MCIGASPRLCSAFLDHCYKARSCDHRESSRLSRQSTASSRWSSSGFDAKRTVPHNLLYIHDAPCPVMVPSAAVAAPVQNSSAAGRQQSSPPHARDVGWSQPDVTPAQQAPEAQGPPISNGNTTASSFRSRFSGENGQGLLLAWRTGKNTDDKAILVPVYRPSGIDRDGIATEETKRNRMGEAEEAIWNRIRNEWYGNRPRWHRYCRCIWRPIEIRETSVRQITMVYVACLAVSVVNKMIAVAL